MRVQRFIFAVALSLCVPFAGGCSGGGGSAADVGSGPGEDASITIDGVTGFDAADEVGGPAPLHLDFRIAFTYQGRVQEFLGQSDLWLLDADGSEIRSLTDFVKSGDPELTCHHSCILDDAMTWLAVADGPRSADGTFSFKMGRFNQAMEVSILKANPLTGVVDLHFAGAYLYYSKLHRSDGASQQFEIWRVSLERPAERDRLFVFPPDEVLSGSIYRGRFSVNPDGAQLVLLNPTIRSQAVYAWRDGHLDQLDYICPMMRSGVCVGTGSEYTDVDPVAISRDGRYVAAFVVAGRELRVRLYDLEDPGIVPYKDLVQVSPGAIYKTVVCDEKEPWQFAYVTGKPHFTHDGTGIYYIGRSDCGGEKPETDVLRVDVARILEPRALEEADIVNLTQIPKTGGPEHIEITSLDLSPDGTVLVFAGTPSYQDNGEPIVAGSSRHRNDVEVWIQGVDGSGLTQLSNDKKWLAVAPKALP